MEVLAALAIFLFSLVALGQLISLTGDRALEVQQLSRASQLSQSKLAEVVSGAVSLSSQSGDFDEDPDWHWEVQADQDSSITGLWKVQVRVSRDMGDGTTIESKVNQMVLDPSLRGSTSDSIPSPTSNSTQQQPMQNTPQQNIPQQNIPQQNRPQQNTPTPPKQNTPATTPTPKPTTSSSTGKKGS
jgi:hypothetical protein